MANRYFINGGINNNWGDTSNWSDTDGGTGGFSVPTSSDDVYLTSLSPNCTLNTSNRDCRSLTCTGYANTFDMSTFQLSVAIGTITLNSTMTLTGTNTVGFSLTIGGTITTGGHILQVVLTFANSQTFTLADDLNTNSRIRCGATTFNSNNINLLNNSQFVVVVNNATCAGTTNINITGSTVSIGADTTSLNTGINMNITINSSGTVTFRQDSNTGGGAFGFGAKTLTYTAGTLVFNCAYIRMVTAGTATFNMGSQTIPGLRVVVSSVTIATTGTLNVAGDSQLIGATVISGTINTYSLTTTGTGQVTGAGSITMNNTGTWSSTTTRISCNLTINTAGTITISGTVYFDTATLTYTAGNVDTSGSTLTIAASTTLNTNGINWFNVTFFTTTGIYTLTTDFTVNGTFTQGSGSTVTFNGADMHCYGNVSLSGAGAIIQGTTDFFFAGTGTWSGNQAFASNLTITGTYTLSGTVAIRGNCTFTCTTGTLITTGSTFEIPNNSAANVVINTNQTLNNFSSGTATITLSQALVITGTLAYLNNATITINGFSITIGGGLTLQPSTIATGTTDLILNGTGTWSGGTLRNNLTINTAGSITIGSGNVGYNTGTLTYTAGTVITTGSTFTIGANTTLNTNGMSFGNISLTAALTLTINSLLSASGTLTLPNANITFAGTSGWSVHTLSQTASLTVTRTYTFVAGKTYTITGQFTLTGSSNAIRALFVSSVGGTRAILTLSQGANQNVGYTNATDIDSNAGQTVYSFNGVITTTFNWNTLIQPVQQTFIFQN